MVDWFLVVSVLVVIVIVFGVMGMLLVYFQHPDDKNQAWVPKAVVLSGLFLASANVLILPLDVGNARQAGGINMSLVWSISMLTTAVVLFFIIPFAYFYYESDRDPNDDTSGCCGFCPYWNGQACEGLKWAIAVLFFFGIILAIMYSLLRTAEIPVNQRVLSWQDQNRRKIPGSDIRSSLSINALGCTGTAICTTSTEIFKIEVTFPVYVMAVMAFVGWFVFVCFGSIGLPALPFDLVNEFRTRPTPMDLEVYGKHKKAIGKRAGLLRKAGEALEQEAIRRAGDGGGGIFASKEQRELNANFRRWENAAYLLKKDFVHLETSYRLKGGNPILYWIKLFLGIIGFSVSGMWILHIGLFMIPPNPPAGGFLNNLLIGLSIPGFPLFGVMAFSYYALWLLFCVIKGNVRFGLRVPVFYCCALYPMELGNTMMNSFLVNTWLILLSSVVVVQFCAQAFSIFVRNTEVDLLFGTQIKYLQFFNYFFQYNVFLYVMLVIVVITIAVMFTCPKDKAADIDAELNSIANSGRSDLGLAAI